MTPDKAFIQHIALLLQPMLLLRGQRYKEFLEWCDEIVAPIALANGDILDKVADQVADNLGKIVDEIARA
jgi:hypothetical protein